MMPRKTRPKTRHPVRTARPESARVVRPEAPIDGSIAPPGVPVPGPARVVPHPRASPRPVGGSQDYAYVRRDLIRIAVIAALLLGGMGALKAATG